MVTAPGVCKLVEQGKDRSDENHASYVSCLMPYVPEGGTLAKRLYIFMEGQNIESLEGFLTYRT